MTPERRNYPRQEAILAVDYSCGPQALHLFHVTTDISPVGVFIRTEHPLDIGSRLELIFSLDSSAEPPEAEDRVLVQGTVTHIRNAGNETGMGIRFDNLSGADWRRLEQFILRRLTARPGMPPIGHEMRLRLKAIAEQSHQLQQDLSDLSKVTVK